MRLPHLRRFDSGLVSRATNRTAGAQGAGRYSNTVQPLNSVIGRHSLILKIKVVGPLAGPGRRGPADSEVIVIQSGVKDQEKAALGFMPPHRIIGKHHYMAAPNRNVDHCGLSGQVGPAGQHSANQQVLFV